MAAKIRMGASRTLFWHEAEQRRAIWVDHRGRRSAHDGSGRHAGDGVLRGYDYGRGLSPRDVLQLFSLQLAILGLLACVAGALLGWLAQFGLFQLLTDLLPQEIPSGGFAPMLAGIATGLVALAGFALPPLAALGRVPPLRVLQRDLLPLPASGWLVYGAALLALGLIMWRLSLDLQLTLSLLGGGLVAALLLGSLLLLSLKGMRRLLAGASLAWRLGLGQLLRHPLNAAGQALAFGLILLRQAKLGFMSCEALRAH